MAFLDDEIKSLQYAQALDSIIFNIADPTTEPKFCLKVQAAINGFPLHTLTTLVRELNEAIAPVIAKHRDNSVGKVKRAVEPYKRDDE